MDQALRIFVPGAFASLADDLEAAFRREIPDANLWFHRFVPSGDLAREILDGALAHVFVSVNRHFMDKIESAGLARNVRELAGNRLAIIIDARSGVRPSTLRETLLGEVRLVVPQPITDPCGQYVRAMLQQASLIDAFTDRLEAGAAIFSHGSGDLPNFLSDGRANVGIFYHSETLALGDRIRVVDLPPDLDQHTSIQFVVSEIVRNGQRHPLAESFVQFLLNAGQNILVANGFMSSDTH